MAEIDRMHESGELEGYFAERVRAWQDQYRAEGRAEGIERGIEQGLERGLAAERDLLCRQAARKFAPARPTGWRVCSRTSATPAALRRWGTGSSTARRARS